LSNTFDNKAHQCQGEVDVLECLSQSRQQQGIVFTDYSPVIVILPNYPVTHSLQGDAHRSE